VTEEASLMTSVRDSTRILSATLEPDGTINLWLILPGGDEPIAATIEPIATTIQAAGPETRPVELGYGAETDRHLRLVIAMHADALAYEYRERLTPGG
jgi:hypothetical protein